MYFKCIFEDGTETYKKLEETEIQRYIKNKALREFISDCVGEDVDDWDWASGYSNLDVIEVDLQKENLLELNDLNLVIDGKNVDKFEFLENSTYEHVLASLSVEEPKDLYKAKFVYFAQKEEDFEDYDDPYSDEPPDYD